MWTRCEEKWVYRDDGRVNWWILKAVGWWIVCGHAAQCFVRLYPIPAAHRHFWSFCVHALISTPMSGRIILFHAVVIDHNQQRIGRDAAHLAGHAPLLDFFIFFLSATSVGNPLAKRAISHSQLHNSNRPAHCIVHISLLHQVLFITLCCGQCKLKISHTFLTLNQFIFKVWGFPFGVSMPSDESSI